MSWGNAAPVELLFPLLGIRTTPQKKMMKKKGGVEGRRGAEATRTGFGSSYCKVTVAFGKATITYGK
jgi:hypothetical protein